MDTVSQVTAFVYAKVFATMPSSVSMNCYVSATRQRLKLEGSRILEFSPSFRHPVLTLNSRRNRGSLSSAAGVFLRAVTTATCLPAPMNSEGQASAEILRNVTNVVVVIVLVVRSINTVTK